MLDPERDHTEITPQEQRMQAQSVIDALKEGRAIPGSTEELISRYVSLSQRLQLDVTELLEIAAQVARENAELQDLNGQMEERFGGWTPMVLNAYLNNIPSDPPRLP